MLTLTDMFCGAGGSSTGAIQVPGVVVRVASNHWNLAIETHNSNHQDADHIQADLSQINPDYFPRTDLLWASPECTNHSRAKGKKKATRQEATISFGNDEKPLPDEAADRSRATMWDVVRFTEAHRYKAIIVENVVEAADWEPFKAWLMAMDALGYAHQIVSLNSMHAQIFGSPAPQSRDRLYIVFHQKGNRRPDLAGVIRPKAWCASCDEMVTAIQAFKKPGATVGRYGARQQYVWRCPKVSCRNAIVEPGWLPASSIIDWTKPGQRIGDRTKPLADKTRARIAAGIARYWSPIHLEAAGNTYDATDPKHAQHGNPNSYYRAWPMDEPLRTLHTIESKALAVPTEGRADVGSARSDANVLRTQTARQTMGLAFVAHLKGSSPSQIKGAHSPISDPLHTVAAGGNHHALIQSYYGASKTSQPVSEALPTVTTTDRHALIHRMNSGGAEMSTPAGEPIRTLTTTLGGQVLLTPADIKAAKAQVDDVLFRMLEPDECKRAMAFPASYIMLGNRREQVRLAGNAVTPPAARDLIACVVESLVGAP